jgi:hypothetical protein
LLFWYFIAIFVFSLLVWYFMWPFWCVFPNFGLFY